jgi:hypothetical protein
MPDVITTEHVSCRLSQFQGALHKLLPSVIPTLQPFKLLKQNIKNPSTPLPVFMKIGMYMMPPETISTACLRNTSH